MRHEVDFETVVNARLLDGLVTCLQTDDILQRQKMNAAQVVSESGDGKPYRCAPLIVAKISGYGCCSICFSNNGIAVMEVPPQSPPDAP